MLVPAGLALEAPEELEFPEESALSDGPDLSVSSDLPAGFDFSVEFDLPVASGLPEDSDLPGASPLLDEFEPLATGIVVVVVPPRAPLFEFELPRSLSFRACTGLAMNPTKSSAKTNRLIT